MKKRMLAAALAAMVAAGCLSGCGDEQAQEPTEKATSFTYWAPLNASIASKVQTLGDVEMYKELEKRTGIHIDFVHPPAGQEAEQFSLMVASRELYDMVEYTWPNYPGGPEKAINDNVIIKLNDYIDQNAPNFKKCISGEDQLSTAYDRGSKTDEGNYFSFPAFDMGKYRTFGGPMIRKDWLDEAGLAVPETMEQWDAALRAFKENNGASAPLTGYSWSFLPGQESFNGAYGIGSNLYVEDGKVKYGPMEENYVEYLKLLNKWYTEGLLDKDFSTNDTTIVASKMTKGNSGAIVGYLGSAMGAYLKQMQTEDPSYNLVCAPYPVLKEGDVNKFMLLENDVENTYLAVTSVCKDPATAVSWIDNFYSDEGVLLVNFGVEGVSYNMVDGYPTYTDVILNNPNGYSINEALGLYTRAAYVAPGFNQHEAYLEQYYEFDQQKEGFKMWAENVDLAKTVKLPEGLIPTVEESEEFAALKSDIQTYSEEMILKFIQGVEPIENYDEFRQSLKDTFQIDRYLEMQQQMYDRYLSR